MFGWGDVMSTCFSQSIKFDMSHSTKQINLFPQQFHQTNPTPNTKSFLFEGNYLINEILAIKIITDKIHKGIKVSITDNNEFFIAVYYPISFYSDNMIKVNNEGTVNTHEICFRKYFFNIFKSN